MFSFRSVVEGLANSQSPHRSPDGNNHEHSESTGTLELPFSESLSSLRKTFSPTRTSTPPPASNATPASGASERPAKRRLEDRLRASFAIGEASDHSTPAVSSRASPSPLSEPSSSNTTSLSPESIPLPSSPPSETSHIPPIFELSDLPHPLATPPASSVLPPPSGSTETSGNASHTLSASSPENRPLPSSPDTMEVVASPLDAVAAGISAAHSPALPVASDHPASSRHVTAEREEVDTAGTEREETHSAEEQPVTTSVDVEIAEEILSVAAASATTLDDSSSAVPQQDALRSASPEPLPSTTSLDDVNVIRERLRLVEQRFSDVSISFKRLQAEKLVADQILQELTSVQTVQDAMGLRDFLQNSHLKIEMAQDEIKRLTGKLTRQDERIEELRETHRLEGRSQTMLIDNLRRQIEEAEALVAASTGSSSEAEKELAEREAELEKATAETEKLKATAKDEEEKRNKAVSLLKTVRQKLVKAEKDRDDALKDATAARDREKEANEKEKEERGKLQAQISQIKAERGSMLTNMKDQHDREIAMLKEKSGADLIALQSRYELQMKTAESAYEQALNSKTVRISGLENSVQTLSAEKNTLFDQLQLRQAELESSQSHLEVLQSQNTELQFQIREHTDRIALLQEELSDARREQESRARNPASSAEDVARMHAAAEARHEAKLADLRRKLNSIEAERAEVEADWSRKLADKVKEVERWKHAVDSSAKSRQDSDDVVGKLKSELEQAEQEISTYRAQITDLRNRDEERIEAEGEARAHMTELIAKVVALQQQTEEAKSREAQARAQSKALREELRKVQTSAALLERSRNPGVGYWSARQENTSESVKSVPTSPPTAPSAHVRSPSPSTLPAIAASASNEEEVNLEYLRNVILQFLEHKEMRPNLVRVLSIILRFTPQETRRLIAKV